MKFIVDAHLPFGIVQAMRADGHDAAHTRELPAGNATSDAEICRIAGVEGRVVVTKDSDFYDSMLLRQQPAKLLLVRVGNMLKRDLAQLFAKRQKELVSLLEQNDFVELNREGAE